MTSEKRCPESQELRRLVAGEGTPSGEEQLAAHLSECPACGDTVEQLLQGDTLCGALQQPTLKTGLELADAAGLAERIKATTSPTFAGCDATLPPEPQGAPADRPDISRLGHYRILQVLGRGGMGVVYQAEDEQLSRTVAIKAMLPGRSDGTARQRFLREARAAAALKHDHVVTIYQVGEDQGIPFIAMEFLAGESLEQRLEREGALPPVEVIRIAREIALALAAAHERGMIHRDIKPGNIWLEGAQGRVKVLDFGLARTAGAAGNADEQQLTQAGTIIGTPAYMAPEQASGRDVDPRSDLFSLGCVLYRLATGRSAFQGRDLISTLLNLTTTEPAAPHSIREEIPVPLSQFILRLLAKDPIDRPQTAKEVVQVLEQLTTDTNRPVVAVSPPVVRRAQPARASMGRKWLALALALGAIVVAAAGMAYRIQTDHGTFVVEINDPEVEVKLRAAGLVLEDKTHKRQFTIKAAGQQPLQKSGDYELKSNQGLQLVVVDDAGLEVPTTDFKLTRGDQLRVRVKLEPLAQPAAIAANVSPQPTPAVAKTAPREAPPPEKKRALAPYVLVHADGRREEFKTFFGAIADWTNGDVLEVRGNGPYELPQVHWTGKSLKIKAAPGSRPSFIPSATVVANGFPWFNVQDGDVHWEGCDFLCERVTNVGLLSTNGNCQIINCRLTKAASNNDTTLYLRGPQNRIVDSLIFNGFSHGSIVLGPKVELEFVNNIYFNAAYVFFNCENPGGQRVKVQNSTIWGSGNFLGVLEKATERITFEASRNLFACFESGPIITAHWNQLDNLKQVVDWRGNQNVFWHIDPRSFLSVDNSKSQLNNLQEWQAYWGKQDQGSIASRGRFFQVDAGLNAATAEACVKAVRAAVESRGVTDFAGPQWDLIGPGAAYVRALAADGREIPEDELRPEQLEGGPITLLRGEAEVGGFPDLGQAAEAAQDGDILEIRTDKEVAGILRQDRPAKKLTLRAGPGYLPIIVGAMQMAKDDIWNIEGLRFKNSLNMQFGANSGHVSRLANCAFDTQPSPHGLETLFLAGRNAGSKLEVTRCVLPNCVGVELLANKQTLHIRDSIILALIFSAAEPGEHRLLLERTVVCNPTLRQGTFVFYPEKSQLLAEAKHCWFEATSLWSSSQPNVNWQGNGNVFAIAPGTWFWPAKKEEDMAYNFSQFQKVTASDADSRAIESLLLDPRQWKMLAGSPGQGAGPEGTDLGADVSQIAIVTPGSSATDTKADHK